MWTWKAADDSCKGLALRTCVKLRKKVPLLVVRHSELVRRGAVKGMFPADCGKVSIL